MADKYPLFLKTDENETSGNKGKNDLLAFQNHGISSKVFKGVQHYKVKKQRKR